ncbi:MAG: zinc-ribbon domain-containing protein, partial [Bacillus sp. (in: firmicutes)]
MKYCKSCGKEVQSGKEFCTNCGEMVESSTLSQDAETNQRSQIRQPTFLNKKGFWILAIIIVILLAALFVGYKIYNSKNHPSKIVQEFENAIEQRDTKKVAQLLNSGQDEMEVKENEVKTMFHYYEAHPDIYADTIQILREEAVALDDNDMLVTKKKKNVFLSLEKTDHKWLLFNQYGLSFKPIYFKITVNQPEVSVTLNDQKQGDIKKDEKKTFGPLLPIEHEIIGTYKGKYGSATVK